ncbi:glycerophosphodiester phosphodiesterase domain-containing protein 1-like isoform X2 [Limulus polyphemus]|uniref:Glycerophosphodiester phosphodiesterase domain-containing protein 1-like isoform X2 n=1 Tax=Limulus polyphemus TaxID=6850 RepID=A0ABM1TL00_LIMPO|nr:glycerophosphodiester phosphodiesterase domain-containing protein 1-like isoform X2 [Limulus polyphemus]
MKNINDRANDNPKIPLLFSARKVFLLVVMMYTGLLPFVPLRESCLELFMPQVLARIPLFEERLKKKRYSILFWLINRLLMNKALFCHLEKRGIQKENVNCK